MRKEKKKIYQDPPNLKVDLQKNPKECLILMLKVKTQKSLINLQQAAKNACCHQLKIKQREEEPAYFVIHCMSTLRLLKVGSNVLNVKNVLEKGVLMPKKRISPFYATFVLLYS